MFHVDATMVRLQLDDRKWLKIASFLDAERGAGRPAKDDRNFVEAVLWWRRTGVPWRDLPDVFGPWRTVFNRFDRWSKSGKWINRAHQHAAGGKGGPRSRGSAARVVGCRRRST